VAGHKFNLLSDSNILSINSPKKSVGGPYRVVYKNISERWVIVAMNWEGKPRLGMRWFWANGGNPFSSGKPIWLVIPAELNKSILNGLSISIALNQLVERFLASELEGPELFKAIIK